MKAGRAFWICLGVLPLLMFLSQNAFSLVLYDDFSGAYIDKARWRQGELVREIDTGSQKLVLKQASPNPITITGYPYTGQNYLTFSDPNSVNSIQTDVAIAAHTITNNAYTRTRIAGRWYSDGAGTPGTDMTGDIWAEVSLRDGPTGLFARWNVYRFTNANGSTTTDLGSSDFVTPITAGTAYTLYMSYNGTGNRFTFRIGAEEATFGPDGLPARVRNPNSPFKALNNRVQIDNPASSCYLAATFDTVHKNGSLYDDFSSSTIDPTKWTAYEIVREISGGRLRSKVRSSSASASSIHSRPSFLYPSSINVIQAKVTPLLYQNNEGADIIARIGGHYYNDGTPGGGHFGEVGAEVRIGGTGVNPVGEWAVWSYTDAAGNDMAPVASGAFSNPISLGNTYTLFIGWNGSQFTFKIDNEEVNYLPVTPINNQHVPWKEIGTRIRNPANKESTIEALFDDVQVGFPIPYDDFQGVSIDKEKWRWGELVREIDTGSHKLVLKQASPNPITITGYPYTGQNYLTFSDPNSVNSIQTDVTIAVNTIINNAYTRARIAGRWYNDGAGTPGTDMTGDIWAEVSLRDGPAGLFARWDVSRFTNANGSTSTSLGGGNFVTAITAGTAYTLYMSYDGTGNRFTFRIGAEEATFGPDGLPARVRNPNNPFKALNNRVQIDDSASSCYLGATFDTVHKNGSLYDDFSSSTIDPTKWTAYEFVREILTGKLRSKVRTSTGSTGDFSSGVEFPSPFAVKTIETKVTPLAYQNANGRTVRARIVGDYYNDGTPGGGHIGDVRAQIRIGQGINPTASWSVLRLTDLGGNASETLSSGAFVTPITVGDTYGLSLKWDGIKFTFKIDDEEAIYTPTTPINPANMPWRALVAQINDPAGNEATIEALFDDVMVNVLPGDFNGDGQTMINEVQRGINQFLALIAVEAFFDLNMDGQVTIDELQRVINAFLEV